MTHRNQRTLSRCLIEGYGAKFVAPWKCLKKRRLSRFGAVFGHRSCCLPVFVNFIVHCSVDCGSHGVFWRSSNKIDVSVIF